MKREIKFRAWDIKHKKFIDLNGFEVAFKNCLNVGSITQIFEQGKLISFNPDEIDLLQFTGLKDKNGKEIYEGDIIKWEWVSENIELVEFRDGAFCPFGWNHNAFQNLNLIEVIGNIYESPNLLKS
jgi:uncharacterized phage protein (TIGR01671 family)